MQNAGLQYGQGVTPVQESPFGATSVQNSSSNSTSSLRQFRKKENVEKAPGSIGGLPAANGIADSSNSSHVARVPPHNHYPHKQNEYFRYPPQYQEYGSPYKEHTVKYSEIAEPVPQSIPHLDHLPPSVLSKHKEKDYVEMCNIPQQTHLNKPYPDHQYNTQQNYPPEMALHHQYMHKEPQVPQMHSPYKPESQYIPKEGTFNHQIPPFLKYNIPQARNYGPIENSSLSSFQRMDPHVARSLMTEHPHMRDFQAEYNPMEQTRMYAQKQRYYPTPLPPSNSTYPPNYPHRNIPAQQYNYPSCNYPRSTQMNPSMGRYPMNMERSISPRRTYAENIDMGFNFAAVPQKLPANYANYPTYAQHYQHRRPTAVPQEYYHPQQHPHARPHPQYMPAHNPQEVSENHVASNNIRQYLENWAEEEPTTEIPTPIENPKYISRINREEANEVYVINASELPQYLEGGVPLVTSENGQYIFKSNVSIDNTGAIKILEKTVESTALPTDTQDRVVSLHIVENPKADCLVNPRTSSMNQEHSVGVNQAPATAINVIATNTNHPNIESSTHHPYSVPGQPFNANRMNLVHQIPPMTQNVVQQPQNYDTSMNLSLHHTMPPSNSSPSQQVNRPNSNTLEPNLRQSSPLQTREEPLNRPQKVQSTIANEDPKKIQELSYNEVPQNSCIIMPSTQSTRINFDESLLPQPVPCNSKETKTEFEVRNEETPVISNVIPNNENILNEVHEELDKIVEDTLTSSNINIPLENCDRDQLPKIQKCDNTNNGEENVNSRIPDDLNLDLDSHPKDLTVNVPEFQMEHNCIEDIQENDDIMDLSTSSRRGSKNDNENDNVQPECQSMELDLSVNNAEDKVEAVCSETSAGKPHAVLEEPTANAEDSKNEDSSDSQEAGVDSPKSASKHMPLIDDNHEAHTDSKPEQDDHKENSEEREPNKSEENVDNQIRIESEIPQVLSPISEEPTLQSEDVSSEPEDLTGPSESLSSKLNNVEDIDSKNDDLEEKLSAIVGESGQEYEKTVISDEKTDSSDEAEDAYHAFESLNSPQAEEAQEASVEPIIEKEEQVEATNDTSSEHLKDQFIEPMVLEESTMETMDDLQKPDCPKEEDTVEVPENPECPEEETSVEKLQGCQKDDCPKEETTVEKVEDSQKYDSLKEEIAVEKEEDSQKHDSPKEETSVEKVEDLQKSDCPKQDIYEAPNPVLNVKQEKKREGIRKKRIFSVDDIIYRIGPNSIQNRRKSVHFTPEGEFESRSSSEEREFPHLLPEPVKQVFPSENINFEPDSDSKDVKIDDNSMEADTSPPELRKSAEMIENVVEKKSISIPPATENLVDSMEISNIGPVKEEAGECEASVDQDLELKKAQEDDSNGISYVADEEENVELEKQTVDNVRDNINSCEASEHKESAIDADMPLQEEVVERETSSPVQEVETEENLDTNDINDLSVSKIYLTTSEDITSVDRTTEFISVVQYKEIIDEENEEAIIEASNISEDGMKDPTMRESTSMEDVEDGEESMPKDIVYEEKPFEDPEDDTNLNGDSKLEDRSIVENKNSNDIEMTAPATTEDVAEKYPKDMETIDEKISNINSLPGCRFSVIHKTEDTARDVQRVKVVEFISTNNENNETKDEPNNNTEDSKTENEVLMTEDIKRIKENNSQEISTNENVYCEETKFVNDSNYFVDPGTQSYCSVIQSTEDSVQTEDLVTEHEDSVKKHEDSVTEHEDVMTENIIEEVNNSEKENTSEGMENNGDTKEIQIEKCNKIEESLKETSMYEENSVEKSDESFNSKKSTTFKKTEPTFEEKFIDPFCNKNNNNNEENAMKTEEIEEKPVPEVVQYRSVIKIEENNVLLEIGGELVEISVNQVNGKNVITVIPLSNSATTVDFNDNYEQVDHAEICEEIGSSELPIDQTEDPMPLLQEEASVEVEGENIEKEIPILVKMVSSSSEEECINEDISISSTQVENVPGEEILEDIILNENEIIIGDESLEEEINLDLQDNEVMEDEVVQEKPKLCTKAAKKLYDDTTMKIPTKTYSALREFRRIKSAPQILSCIGDKLNQDTRMIDLKEKKSSKRSLRMSTRHISVSEQKEESQSALRELIKRRKMRKEKIRLKYSQYAKNQSMAMKNPDDVPSNNCFDSFSTKEDEDEVKIDVNRIPTVASNVVKMEKVPMSSVVTKVSNEEVKKRDFKKKMYREKQKLKDKIRKKSVEENKEILGKIASVVIKDPKAVPNFDTEKKKTEENPTSTVIVSSSITTIDPSPKNFQNPRSTTTSEISKNINSQDKPSKFPKISAPRDLSLTKNVNEHYLSRKDHSNLKKKLSIQEYNSRKRKSVPTKVSIPEKNMKIVEEREPSKELIESDKNKVRPATIYLERQLGYAPTCVKDPRRRPQFFNMEPDKIARNQTEDIHSPQTSNISSSRPVKINDKPQLISSAIIKDTLLNLEDSYDRQIQNYKNYKTSLLEKSSLETYRPTPIKISNRRKTIEVMSERKYEPIEITKKKVSFDDNVQINEIHTTQTKLTKIKPEISSYCEVTSSCSDVLEDKNGSDTIDSINDDKFEEAKKTGSFKSLPQIKTCERVENDWEDSNSPKDSITDAFADSFLENTKLESLKNKNKGKLIIDINDFDTSLINNELKSPYRGSFNNATAYEDDGNLKNYKEEVDSKLNSLNILIPKTTKSRVPSEDDILMHKFLRKEQLNSEEIKQIRRIIYLKKKIQQFTQQNIMSPSIQNLDDNYEVKKKFENVSHSDLKLQLKKIDGKVRKKKKRFRNLYSESPETSESEILETAGEFSVYEGENISGVKLIFKRKTDLLHLQPVVKLQRCRHIESMAKKLKFE